MSYMPDPKAKPASTDPKRGKYVAKPAPKPVYAGVHVGKPKPPVSEAINSPFTRDAYPALTDAILGVVNGQPREVEEEVTPKRMEVLNRAVKTGMAGALGNAQSRALADRASLAITRAYATKGGKKVTGFEKAKREHEGAKARHKTLKKAVKESQELDERIIDEVDAFQAAKNWVKGKGFKTNREVSYAKVQKNYDAMKKRQAAEAKNKSK